MTQKEILIDKHDEMMAKNLEKGLPVTLVDGTPDFKNVENFYSWLEKCAGKSETSEESEAEIYKCPMGFDFLEKGKETFRSDWNIAPIQFNDEELADENRTALLYGWGR